LEALAGPPDAGGPAKQRTYGGPVTRSGKLRGDGLLLVAAGDLDAARLGGFVDRDGQGEHARRVVGGDLVGVQGFTEEDLPGVGAVGPFGDQQLGAIGLGPGRVRRGR